MIFQLFAWLKYLLKARGAHLLHSPFVFSLYTRVIRGTDEISEPETFRKQLIRSERKIRLYPIGAGSRKMRGDKAMLKHIASSSLLPARHANLLFRLVKHFQPSQILELGTSAGVTTLYLSLANEKAIVHTIEGNPDMAAVAGDLFSRAGRKNIRLVTGLFSDCLPRLLRETESPDFIFLDGDHRREPVLQYVKLLLPVLKENAVLVIDDIHWSREMEEAWQLIKQMTEVTVTIDLFRMGIVFFRKNQAKQHFILRF